MTESLTLTERRAFEHAKYVRAYQANNYGMGWSRMMDAVADLVELPDRGSYLDVGCGRGEMLAHATALGFEPVQGTEIVPSLIDGARVVRAEVHELPFKDLKFDVVSLFDVILAPPRFGQDLAQTQWESLSATGKVAACLTRLWVGGVMLLLWAYAVSYYVCASTWVYLLLRRSADGTEFDDVYSDATGHTPPTSPPGGEANTGGEAPALASQIDQVAIEDKRDSGGGDPTS